MLHGEQSPYVQSFDVTFHDVLLGISVESVVFSIGIFENSTQIINANWQYQMKFHFGVSGTQYVEYRLGIETITTYVATCNITYTTVPVRHSFDCHAYHIGEQFPRAASKKFYVQNCRLVPDCFVIRQVSFLLVQCNWTVAEYVNMSIWDCSSSDQGEGGTN